ncbi:L-seryl-tRNA(Sec) selenium transferase [Halomonas sp. McH1-25]|uniref:L-seryl-tRNA(Sec) selenium transferase n=1 Tax=unclassified Halomonas TaxID=2609666 RepID=UPI001EF6A9CC|nr:MULTISPECIES: L-seryl-tRNA(Sec) selenium transferase [unclassified Halomonas]MCG7600978.1 L-seryl-tRNA(Sec) selenium transferase [Halomonas sp. McH1-25]MCP1342070.1 L-seryl-tRNA(Sec) selenium transferase [Halomonas sp. FL8]MCP1359748.1 L-seryl-tRNA(Sec) selenium transferase [Halomonas sp. BBD45]
MDVRRHLPAVDVLMAASPLQESLHRHGHSLVKRAVRDTLDDERRRLLERPSDADMEPPALDDLAQRCALRLDTLIQPNSRAVFNLTGTVIHTNLGRSPLPEPAIEAMAEAARHPVALEYDLESGGRGDRDTLVESLLCELTGAEAATVVNNNAGAVVLALGALGAGREAIISRGELIEIGGAFRMPDIMQAAGCRLHEVGATNRTHARDFEAALNEETGLIVKAHTSNYAISGFTKSVPERELAEIAHRHGVPMMVDLGSGALTDLAALGLPYEALPRDTIAAGADIVTFSGDKLLGGPQAGIIVGKREMVERIKRHPLKRALRLDKLMLAALEATLRIYRDSDAPARDIPTLALLTRPEADIAATGERLLPAVRSLLDDVEVALQDCMSQLGSGSLPVDRLPSRALVWRPKAPDRHGRERALRRLEAAFRRLPRPVIGRLRDGALHLDLRCLVGKAQEQRFLDQLEALRMNYARSQAEEAS